MGRKEFDDPFAFGIALYTVQVNDFVVVYPAGPGVIMEFFFIFPEVLA